MNILPKEEIINPNSLANFFAEMHEAYLKRLVPMTEEQSKYTISIMMTDDNGIDKMYEDFSNQFPFGGLFKRCTIFPIKYEKRLLCWLGLMTYQFNIGGMILVAYYVQWRIKELAKKQITVANEIELGPLTLDLVCEKVFPFGVFNKELVHEYWDKQKVAASPDNLIDHRNAGASFMPIEDKAPIVS